MNPEEFRALTTRIAQNLDNQALVTELLTQATDTFTQSHQNIENLTEQVTKYEGKIKDLQQTNMNLFLKVAQPVPTEPLQKGEPMTYENLINELWGDK